MIKGIKRSVGVAAIAMTAVAAPFAGSAGAYERAAEPRPTEPRPTDTRWGKCFGLVCGPYADFCISAGGTYTDTTDVWPIMPTSGECTGDSMEQPKPTPAPVPYP